MGGAEAGVLGEEVGNGDRETGRGKCGEKGERENENTEAEQMTEGRFSGKKRTGAEMMAQ